ncbi:hypothetical protein C0J52_02532 [Blattella germanica]|nr:hypothetical protein C0J52_02532 [Blattella germanica]
MKVKLSLIEDIKTAQLRCFGHVRRMREDRLPKKIFEWQPMGRRKRGLPNITWTEGILKTYTNTIELASSLTYIHISLALKIHLNSVSFISILGGYQSIAYLI